MTGLLLELSCDRFTVGDHWEELRISKAMEEELPAK